MPDSYDANYWTITTNDLGWSRAGGYVVRTVSRSLRSDPKWQEKVAKFLNATLTYQRLDTVSRIIQRPVSWVWIYKPNATAAPRQTQLRGDPVSLALSSAMAGAPQPSLDEMRSLCKLDFLGKIREAESPFQAGAFFGELKETIGMIRHPLRGVLKTTKSYHNRVVKLLRVPRKADQLSERLGNAYLQWTYGVAPFISDIENITTSVENLLKVPTVTRLSVSKKDRVPVPTTSGNGLVLIESGTGGFIRQLFLEGDYKVRITGALKAALSGPSLPHLQEEWSLRASDFVPTVYELIPYSFVVDYFSTVGAALNGVFTNTRNLIYASESVKAVLRGMGLAVPVPGTTGIPISWPFSATACELERLTFNRYKADLSVSLRDLHFVHPTVGQWFNTTLLGLHRFRSAKT